VVWFADAPALVQDALGCKSRPRADDCFAARDRLQRDKTSPESRSRPGRRYGETPVGLEPVAYRSVGVRPPTVLALVDYYPPAYLAGGPTRSIPRLVERLSGFSFVVVTRDRDLGASARLAGVTENRWTRTGKANCLYLSRARSWPAGLWWAIRRISHDVVYLNSVFSIQFTFVPLLLRQLRLIPRRGLIIAPRGELDSGALGIKRTRKRLYLWVMKRLRLLDEAIWHASTEAEALSVRRSIAQPRAVVIVAPDVSIPSTSRPSRRAKTPGTLELVFLSRVARKKNLMLAIDALHQVKGTVTFNIIGPLEDHRYWHSCLRAAASLPENIAVRYRGTIKPGDAAAALATQHLFILPTLGENYGHAIVESLLAGCPVLISDRTPWRDLEKRHAGWDLPLSEPQSFRDVIQRCVDMDERQLVPWTVGAYRFGVEIASNPNLGRLYEGLFQLALRAGAANAGNP
jgi:glycosyltransferase involved in cell wall biosynthesis